MDDPNKLIHVERLARGDHLVGVEQPGIRVVQDGLQVERLSPRPRPFDAVHLDDNLFVVRGEPSAVNRPRPLNLNVLPHHPLHLLPENGVKE